MNKNSVRLFVYGSLMPGGTYYDHIRPFIKGMRPASISGVLVNLEEYPALIHGAGEVQGMLLELRPGAIPVADEIEQHTGNASTAEYNRQTVSVRTETGESLYTFTYYYARPEEVQTRPRAIVGDRNGLPLFRWNPLRSERHSSCCSMEQRQPT